MSTQAWTDPRQAQTELQQQGWTWLIHSSRNVPEERAQWANTFWQPTQRIGLDRTDLQSPHRFKLHTLKRQNDSVNWTELAAWLAHEIKPGHSVLIDMCLLGFDAVLYLLPALLDLKLKRLGVLYVAPQEYDFPKDPLADLLLQPIEQPKAYVASLSHDKENPKTRHLVFLGFDHARAWKFIDARAWKLQNVHVALGDPPFVQNGAEKARAAAEPWLSGFETEFPAQLHCIAAHNPTETVRLCQEIFQSSEWLDIVPIGPKPMNLGVLWFYFSLTENQRARVRLLYDFPQQQTPRSTGLGSITVYDCKSLLRAL